jgi:YhcH/YjgK/YiaL family protein
MFSGHIEYTSDDFYPPVLNAVLAYLRETDFLSMEPGQYPLHSGMTAHVVDLKTQPDDTLLPEVHRQFIDVHFLCKGQERMGFAPDSGRNQVAEDQLKERDLMFYQPVEHEHFLNMTPGWYAVFFPSDVHRPGIQQNISEVVRKVVVKIPVDQFNASLTASDLKSR